MCVHSPFVLYSLAFAAWERAIKTEGGHGMEKAVLFDADVVAAHFVHLSWDGVSPRSFPAGYLH